MSQGNSWTKKDVIELLISIVAIILSIVAILVSSRANKISNDSYQLSLKADTREVNAIWLGTYDNNKNELSINSFRDDIVMQTCEVVLPDQTRHFIYSFQNSVSLQPVEKLLKEKLTPFVKEKDSKCSLPAGIAFGKIPIIIKSEYIFKGESFTSTSIYNISYHAKYALDTCVINEVFFEGMVFDRHLKKDEVPNAYSLMEELVSKSIKEVGIETVNGRR